AVWLPTTDIAEIERRGSRAAKPLRSSHELFEESKIQVRLRAPVIGQAGGERRLVHFFDVRGLNRAAVECASLAFDGPKALSSHGIINQSQNDFAVVLQGDRNAELRIAVGEVRRAVQWIDDPAVIALGADEVRFLFRQYRMIRKVSL